MNEEYYKQELQYQREHHLMESKLNLYKTGELLKQIAITYAARIKKNDCMFTRDSFIVYLQSMADTIANSDQELAALLPVVQEIKNHVLGG